MPITKIEDFRTWIRSIDRGPYYVGTHRFEKIPSGKVLIDRRAFELEEVEQIAEMPAFIKPYLEAHRWNRNLGKEWNFNQGYPIGRCGLASHCNPDLRR